MENKMKMSISLLPKLLCVSFLLQTDFVECNPARDYPINGKDSVTMHLCPFLCTMGDQWSCVPPPCPFPPCVKPVGHKPTDCCKYCPDGTANFTPFSCPLPPVGHKPTDCCKYCPDDVFCSFDQISTDAPGVGTKNVTAHYCPYPCTAGNETLCYPPPCPPPFCVDPMKVKPTDCCEYCPNGPDCGSPDGVPIKYNHWRIVSGKNCTCQYPPNESTCM